MKDLVVMERLYKNFDDVVALKNINLKLGKGIIGLIGPNGSGKTTLIRILLGLIKPTSGKAYCLGFDCWKESTKIRDKIGVMLERPIYPKSLSCRDYLHFIAEIRGLNYSETIKQIEDVLSFVELEGEAHRKINTLSAGMQRRFSLACALMGDPKLLILDEPTANMDVDGRLRMLNKIKEIYYKKGISVIISSHILPELTKVCNYIVFMKSGVILDHGPVDYLTDKYKIRVNERDKIEALYLKLVRRI
ncbi:MAG: ABC transporter ATP-binding protein [archaeon GB-1867-035]|nr:ABC transporter ATP-binding protein [Candidatus Culexmicrobium profundum]